jgi:hypothetical protein
MSLTFLQLAVKVLKDAEQPLTYQEIWSDAEDRGLSAAVSTKGKTPWATLGSQLYVDVRDNEASNFVIAKKRPARFFLKTREQEIDLSAPNLPDRTKKRTAKQDSVKYMEKDLHPVLAYYAYADPSFNHGRPVYLKTISDKISKKGGYSEWTNPDMVGFSYPFDEWSTEVLKFNELLDKNSLVTYSFELKKVLNKSTYRESFFQAVSNSSWAHQGYLVAAEIAEDDDLLSELERLTNAFGIGIIRLDINDFSSSRVVFPAKKREELDWETVSKLSDQNSDFREFLNNVRIDITSNKPHRAEYDEIRQDIEHYLYKLIK